MTRYGLGPERKYRLYSQRSRFYRDAPLLWYLKCPSGTLVCCPSWQGALSWLRWYLECDRRGPNWCIDDAR